MTARKDRQDTSSHTYVSRGEVKYEEEVRLWAASLDEVVLRSMVRDYRHGVRDEPTVDAYNEMRRRANGGLLRARGAKPRCPDHAGKQGRGSEGCHACTALLMETLDHQVMLV